MKLTIGMATYDDFHGVYFTIQALKTYHRTCLATFTSVEILVIDNNPDSPHGKAVQAYCKNSQTPGIEVRYIQFQNSTGTTQTRERVFQNATGDLVVCMDCHVLLHPGALSFLHLQVVSDSKKHPDKPIIYSGPMVYDDNYRYSTHFDPIWRGQMLGIWANAWRTPDGQLVVVRDEGGRASYVDLNSPHRPVSGPEQPYAGHRQGLLGVAWHELAKTADEPSFEIPAQGLGLFACRKQLWLGFNPNFRGFGGEEVYIHEKFRQAGGMALCVPGLRWGHRFGRPEGVKYPLTMHNKVRNYILGHKELGWDTTPIREHFVGENKMPPDQYDAIIANPEKAWDTRVLPVGKTSLPSPAIIRDPDQLYTWGTQNPRDLDKHFPILRDLAGKCEAVAELTKRRESTIPLLAANGPLYSFQAETGPLSIQIAQNHEWVHLTPIRPDQLPELPGPVDMLFLDLRHNEARQRAELAMYSEQVNRFIVWHDTHTHAEQGDDGGPGMRAAIEPWLRENQDWRIIWHDQQQYGLTVASRNPDDWPAERMHAWPPGYGPGTALKGMLEKIGIVATPNCSCRARADLMDRLGCQWCRDNEEMILDWLGDEAKKRSLPYVRAGAKLLLRRAVRQGAKQVAKHEAAMTKGGAV